MSVDPIGDYPLVGFAGSMLQLYESDGLTLGQGDLFKAVQQLSLEEQATKIPVPGSNATYASKGSVNSATSNFRFAGMDLRLLAKYLGSRYQAILDANGKIVEFLDRRTDDVAPAFKMIGLVDWIGPTRPKGEHHFIGWFGTITGPPKITHASNEAGNVELEIEWLNRKDGKFWSMKALESGSGLNVDIDVTPPAVASSSPADNATNVAVTGTRTITFDKPVLLREDDWKFYEVNGLVLTEGAFLTLTISDNGKVISYTTASLDNSQEYLAQGKNVADFNGNVLELVERSFTTVAP